MIVNFDSIISKRGAVALSLLSNQVPQYFLKSTFLASNNSLISFGALCGIFVSFRIWGEPKYLKGMLIWH